MLSAALGRHGARSGAVPEPPQTRPAAFGRIWDEVRRLWEALELQISVLDGSRRRWNCKNIVLEGSRRRWNYKNNVLEGSRRRWNYENNVLEGSRRRWNYENSVLEGSRRRWNYKNNVLEGFRRRSLGKNTGLEDPSQGHECERRAQRLLSRSPPKHQFLYDSHSENQG